MTAGHPFSTRKGRRLRDAKLRSVNWRCERCRQSGYVVEAKHVHHIVALGRRRVDHDAGDAGGDLRVVVRPEHVVRGAEECIRAGGGAVYGSPTS